LGLWRAAAFDLSRDAQRSTNSNPPRHFSAGNFCSRVDWPSAACD
jgi:hypothetical protein